MNDSGDQSTSAEPGPEQHYWNRLAEGVLEIQQCDDCGRYIFYPRVSCTHCGSSLLTWRRPSGHGAVYSTTVVRRRAEEGGDYNVAIVELAEGPRMMSRIDGVSPAQVTIGLRVLARIEGAGKDAILVFLPDGKEASNG